MPVPSLLFSSLAFLAEPAAAASPAPAADPATATAPTPATTPTDKPYAPDEPKYKGTGMLVTTSVIGAASLGVTIARSVVLKKNCPLEDGTAACTYDFGSDIGLAATQWTLNIATIGLSAGTGVLLGRYHAFKDVGSGRVRKAKVLQAAGGGLIGAGIVGIGTSVALAFVLPKRCLDKELDGGDPLSGDRCLLKAYPAWTMTNWASFSMVSAGAGMVAYGGNYKGRRGAVADNLRWSPFAGRTFAGMGVSGRF